MNTNTKIEHAGECTCFTCEPKKYDIYILDSGTCKAVKMVGSNLSTGRAYICEKNTDRIIDKLRYFVLSVEVGTARDLELTRDLI